MVAVAAGSALCTIFLEKVSVAIAAVEVAKVVDFLAVFSVPILVASHTSVMVRVWTTSVLNPQLRHVKANV
jgi:hypothetical protein